MNKKEKSNENQYGQNQNNHILLIHFLVVYETRNDFGKSNHQIYKETQQELLYSFLEKF
jgi:hypothetical protein